MDPIVHFRLQYWNVTVKPDVLFLELCNVVTQCCDAML